MPQLPSNPRSPFEIRPHHVKKLFGGFILIGLLFGLLLSRLMYAVVTDTNPFPADSPSGKTWGHTPLQPYLSICIPCLLFDIAGTIVIIVGQLKEKRKLMLLGVGLIAVAIAVSLATIIK